MKEKRRNGQNFAAQNFGYIILKCMSEDTNSVFRECWRTWFES